MKPDSPASRNRIDQYATMRPARKCRGTLLCLSAFYWAVCSTETRAKPKARVQVSLSKKCGKNALIDDTGQVRSLTLHRLFLTNCCDLGFCFAEPRKCRRHRCISEVLGLRPAPYRSSARFRAENPTTWLSHWHRESLRARVFTSRPFAPYCTAGRASS